MGSQFFGGIIRSNPISSDSLTTSGIFKCQDAFISEKMGVWPSNRYIFAGNMTGTAVTGSIIVPSTSAIVYGVAGGGNGASNGQSGGGGGGGGAVQLTGYSLTGLTPGETLTYSVGSYSQDTTISRGGTPIFLLNKGSSTTSSTGASGGAANSYSSAAGGNGGAGSIRQASPTGAGGGGGGGTTGGGGGGGCWGDPGNFNGTAGSSGGSSSINLSLNLFPCVFTGISGTAGTNYNSGSATNATYAQGGTAATGDNLWGGAGGAGGGIKCNLINSNLYAFGGGAGGCSGSSGTPSYGGPGFLIIDFI